MEVCRELKREPCLQFTHPTAPHHPLTGQGTVCCLLFLTGNRSSSYRSPTPASYSSCCISQNWEYVIHVVCGISEMMEGKICTRGIKKCHFGRLSKNNLGNVSRNKQTRTLSRKCLPASEELVHENPKGPKIHAEVMAFTQNDFGGNILRGSTKRPGFLPWSNLLGKSKINLIKINIRCIMQSSFALESLKVLIAPSPPAKIPELLL